MTLDKLYSSVMFVCYSQDDNGMLVFRPAPNEQGSNSFYLKDFDLMKAAFQAKVRQHNIPVPYTNSFPDLKDVLWFMPTEIR